MDIKICSAFNVCFSPPFTGSIVIYPLLPLFLPEITLCPVRIVIPCFVNILWKLLATYKSKDGQISSRYSTTVTFVPNLW